jgi:hypothetical protein
MAMWIKTCNNKLFNFKERILIVNGYICNDKVWYVYGDDAVTISKYKTEEEAHAMLDLIAKAISDGKPLFDVALAEKKEQAIKGKSEHSYHEDVEKIVQMWNDLESYGIKPVTKITATSSRYKNTVARLREYSIKDFEKAIENIKQSDFLQGKMGDKWASRGGFDYEWFVKPNNFPKVLEGKYNNTADSRLDEEETDFWG